MLNFGSSIPQNSETGNSILSLLSGPPSLLQYDFHHQSNLKSSSNSGSSYPNQSASQDVNTLGNWPLLHGNGNLNPGDGVEVNPAFPCRSPMSGTNGSSRGICDDLDTLKSFVNRTDFRNESVVSTSLQKGLTCSSSSNRDDESHALSKNSVSEASLQNSSSTSTNRPSFMSRCPRVFCMGACGDLLLSNTGLFGIFCSCHGMRMSVLKFCEHSGLFDVNPAYAVRMDSGESIAQWRKVYFQKFGITAPEDHIGWDWPGENLPTSHSAKNKMVAAERKKVFDLSGLFTSSAESVKSTMPKQNVSVNGALSSEKYANQVAKYVNQNYGCEQCSFQMSLMGNSGRFPHTIPESPQTNCFSPTYVTAPQTTWKGNLQSGPQPTSFISNICSSREIPPSSVIKTSQNIASKSPKNLKDGAFQWKSDLPSSIELKLGQPSQLGWGSTSPSALKPHFSDVPAISVEEKLTSNKRENSKVTETSSQNSRHCTASICSRTKEQIQPVFPNNAPGTALGSCQSSHVVSVIDGLSSTSTTSRLIPSSNTSGGGVLFHKENNKAIIDSHPIIPSALQYQPSVGKPSLINFSCNGNTPIRPVDVSKLALSENKSKTPGVRDRDNDPTLGNGSSVKLYAKQMEKFSSFSSHDSHLNSCRITASTYTGVTISPRTYPEQDHFANAPKTSSIVSGTTLQTVSSSFTSLTTSLLPGHEFSSCNKDVDASSSHMTVDSLRLANLKNMKYSNNARPEDAPPGSNQQWNNSDHRRQSKNDTISDLGEPNYFLNRGPLEGKKDTMPTFLSDVGYGKGFMGFANFLATPGANSLESCSACTRKTTDDNKGPYDPQLEQRFPNEDRNCTVLQRDVQGPYAYNLTDLRNCTTQMTCANQKSQPEGSGLASAVQKQVSIPAFGAPKLSGIISPNDTIPLEKHNLVACHQKGIEQLQSKPNCFSSQWRDVSSRTSTGSKRRCLDTPTHLSEMRGKFKAHLDNNSYKGKEISISSGCSDPTVTEASSQVNKTDCCNFSGSGIGNVIDRVVDQESVIRRSCSSGDTIDSVKRAQPGNNTKPMFSETASSNIGHHTQIDEFKQKNSKFNKLQNLYISAASLDKREEHVDKYEPRERKGNIERSMRGTGLDAADDSLLPANYQLTSDTSANHQTRASDGVKVLNGNLNGHGLKKRSTLCQVKLLSQKRDLHGRYPFVDGEHNDQILLNGSNEFIGVPVDTSVKRLKTNKIDDALGNRVKSTKDLKGMWLHNPNSDESSRCNLKSCTNAKPIACGKYGVLCDQELDIDQLKPPKIVPLSKVLKVSKRCTISEKQSAAHLGIKMNAFVFNEAKNWSDLPSNTQIVQGRRCNEVLSCNDRKSDASIQDTQQMRSDSDGHAADDISMLEVGVSGQKKNPLLSSYHPASQSKTKETRMRNLYELSMRGNKFISADSSLSQNVMCAPSKCNVSEAAGENDGSEYRSHDSRRSFERRHCHSLILDADALCCVCGISNKDDFNCLLECGRCLIKIHQACYGISRVPKGEWFCRPCRTNSKDVVCVLCGYGGGAMTRAFGSRNVVKTLLKAWNIKTESHIVIIGSAESFHGPAKAEHGNNLESSPVVHNSIIAGLFNPTVKQWVHMVCGLWTQGTRCPNVDTMSAFDVSGVYYLNTYVVCCICKRSGGSCIKCRIETCSAHFHPWCAHQKGLLQSEVEGVDSDQIGFYGRCLLHASNQSCVFENDEVNKAISDTEQDQEPTCARMKAYQGKRQEGRWSRSYDQRNEKGGCLVTQVQLDAWLYINKHKLSMKWKPNPPISDVEHDYRKEYARFKGAKGWKSLVVYKSGIHALGLYTSHFIPRGAMVVEYVGEIVGSRVADKRETEYLTGRKLQYKSACYFFRIDKEQIIDATCKGGIARFVNHSCQPNCIAKVITIRSQKKVVFFAQTDICPGEEITYDYHFNHEDEGKKIPCFCNAKNCRRYLN